MWIPISGRRSQVLPYHLIAVLKLTSSTLIHQAPQKISNYPSALHAHQVKIT